MQAVGTKRASATTANQSIDSAGGIPGFSGTSAPHRKSVRFVLPKNRRELRSPRRDQISRQQKSVGRSNARSMRKTASETRPRAVTQTVGADGTTQARCCSTRPERLAIFGRSNSALRAAAAPRTRALSPRRFCNRRLRMRRPSAGLTMRAPSRRVARPVRLGGLACDQSRTARAMAGRERRARHANHQDECPDQSRTQASKPQKRFERANAAADKHGRHSRSRKSGNIQFYSSGQAETNCFWLPKVPMHGARRIARMKKSSVRGWPAIITPSARP